MKNKFLKIITLAVFSAIWINPTSAQLKDHYIKAAFQLGFRYDFIDSDLGLYPNQNNVFNLAVHHSGNYSLSWMMVKNRKRYLEIGLNTLIIRNGTIGRQVLDDSLNLYLGALQVVGDVKNFMGEVMVETGRNFNPNPSGKREVYGGIFFSQSYLRRKYIDEVFDDSTYTQRVERFGTTLGLLPRLHTNLGKKLVLELGCRVDLFRFSFVRSNNENPQFNDRQRMLQNADFDIFTGMFFRIGLGFKVNKVQKPE